MSTSEGVSSRPRTRKQPGTDAGTSSTLAPAPPTTFFFRSEREMQQVEGISSTDDGQDSTFGVQSLEETLDAAFPPTSPQESSSPVNPVLGRKRRVGNPVHPKIAAAAQRIISSDRPSSRASSGSSSVHRHPSLSPSRRPGRSDSTTSFGRTFAPLRYSPAPDAVLPGTPRSGSVRSVRLSDEEGSIIDEFGSQAIHSSSEDEDVHAEDTLSNQAATAEACKSIPQLVMPSISMPARRPFTERGKHIPRLKVLMAGPAGVGKTSLIRSIVQTCEDIVHVDPINNPLPLSRSTDQHATYVKTTGIYETNASTKSYPSWWSDIEQSRGLRRRKSMGDSVLERNICFVDTPGWDNSGMNEQENMHDAIDTIVAHVEGSMRHNVDLNELNDADLLSVLGGGGGFQVDAVLYLFHPTCHHISPAEIDVLRRLSSLTNVVPVIGRADTCPGDLLKDARSAIRTGLEAAGIRTFTLQKGGSDNSIHQPHTATLPFTVSSALGDDTDFMDASVLMSSEYLQPLVPSDLAQLVDQLFDPDNVQWLRHCAVKKFLQWRRNNIGTSLDLHKRELRELAIGRLGWPADELDVPSSVSSVLSSPAGVLMPQFAGLSQRGSSPTPFRLVPAAGIGTASQYDFGRHIDIHTIDKANMQIPRWAQDLRMALEAEQRDRRPGSSSQDNTALIKHDKSASKHGCNTTVGSIDPSDPLGLLAFGQQLHQNVWKLLRFAGGCGAAATILVWVFRNWGTVTETLGFSTPEVQIPGHAYVTARESNRGPMDFLRAMLVEEKW